MGKFTIKNYEPKTGLEKSTKRLLNRNIDTKDRQQGFFDDLSVMGCSSGVVGGLIYYSETLAFYRKNKTDINNLISETLKECGYDSMTELFGTRFDSEDPLCLETNNQNLLAWFGFEMTARKIGSDIGLDV